jgi:hypothetical protein
MASSEEFVRNERLQRARSLKGWSQADLAEQVGTSFEIVSAYVLFWARAPKNWGCLAIPRTH